MFNPRAFYNSRPDGFGVLELPTETPDGPRRFAPLKHTHISCFNGSPVASIRLTQTFAVAGRPDDPPIEALYRFPLPGDAAVTGVRVRFGDVEIHTILKERSTAEAEYDAGKREGRQAALVTRESPDVFTLAVAGIRPGQEVQVETSYVQVVRAERDGWSLRVPLTTAPRYVREDEAGARHAQAQPLALLRDPGHRFTVDLPVGLPKVSSPSHPLAITHTPNGVRYRLRDGEAIPDRDFIVTWRSPGDHDRPTLSVFADVVGSSGWLYFLALCVPPARTAAVVPREVILLVDHSGSMEGPKWEAADWAVERFLAGLTDRDTFTLGLFHNTTRWFAPEPQQATVDAVRRAVAFLKENRDSGGTELGVALEQALGMPRQSGTAARNVLIITDAEVTDAGRLLRLVEREADRADRRRVSILCIDAAPNAALATELAERGGGVSRFLTSDPAEDDVTTALDEVLTDWAAPVYTGLTLEVNNPKVEAVGHLTSVRTPGAATAIDLGDPPAGRPVWVVGRVPWNNYPLDFRVTAGPEVLAEYRLNSSHDTDFGPRYLFGADRIRRLEYLAASGLTGDQLRTELDRLGYEPAGGRAESAVYPENARMTAEGIVKPLLAREALAFGLPSSETAFVAVRTEAGTPVERTVLVANALPAGWSPGFLGGVAVAAGGMLYSLAAPTKGGARAGIRRAMYRSPAPAAADAEFLDSNLADFDADEDEDVAHKTSPAARAVRLSIPAGQHPTGDGSVLFDSDRDGAAHPLPARCRLTGLALAARDPGAAGQVGPELALLVFVGDLAVPRARVRVADLLGGGRRPLNLKRTAGQVVRLVIEDPTGQWKTGVPALEVTLDWDG